MRSVDELIADGVAGRRVLLRADLNVPLDKKTGAITDDGRIRASLPTLQALQAAGARVIVAAHLGRPKGAPDPQFSLAPVAARLGEMLGSPVTLAGDVAGADATAKVAGLADGDVLMLENVRFEAAETSKDDAVRGELADRLAGLADLYVDDAFGAVHRKHASVYDVALRLPHAAGRLVARELDVLTRLTESPERPYVVVLGGSKVSDKLGVIEALLPRVDKLLIGGGMTYTFLAAQGLEVGKSLLEADQVDTCRRLLAEAGDRIVLPVDLVSATEFSAEATTRVVPFDAIPADEEALDIGPRSVELFTEQLAGARTVFWNGPVGVFELAPFQAGTRGVAQAVAAVDGLSVVGGGDSAASVRTLGLDEAAYGHISTGGGASLEFLEGRELPGLAVLAD
ncbi:phosphoglycerate kinase [Modestobacter muralis]|uniref:Phosphoglycerate kinase n=1 Tax=Modestobacter muralis TaxID=1608614 RepID=A0A6P0EQ74_9ACTN|nr:phosphoglycerate kinase [Modestobacter muralis]NEK92943.1 phosphoglycerate kinase [Modestobacter muralis]NEN49710.1 phosphoglycerate kinase [Modestobacter muralis]